MQVPFLTYVERSASDETGYFVGIALDELVSWAKEHGCSDTELEERLQEALDRADEEVPL